jgi:hypothetical protein
VAARLAKIRARIWAANRGAAIFHLPEEVVHDERERSPQHAAADILRTVSANGHKLQGHRDGFRCTVCGAIRGWKKREYWASVSCRPRPPADVVVKRLRTGGHNTLPTPTAHAHLAGAAREADAASGPCSVDGGDGCGQGHGLASGPSRVGELAGQGKRRRRGFDDSHEGNIDDIAYLQDIGYSGGTGTTVGGEILGDDGAYHTGHFTTVFGEAYGIGDDFSVGDYKADDGKAQGAHASLAQGNSAGAGAQSDIHPADDDPERVDEPHQARPLHSFDLGDDQDSSFEVMDDTQEVVVKAGCPFEEPPNAEDLVGESNGNFEDQSENFPQPLVHEARTVEPTLVIRRRLTGKTNPEKAATLGHCSSAPAGTAPTESGLVTREVARAAQKRRRDAARVHSEAVKQARTAAWSAIRRNPEAAGGSAEHHREVQLDPLGEETAIPDLWNAHPSHDVASSPGVQVVYCRRCGSWSLGVKSRNLVKPCTLKPGHSGNLRLLRLGIVPRRGARVPAELKQTGARGTRGGSFSRRPTKTRGRRR